MTEERARHALVAAGRRLLKEGLVSRSWGNISVLVDDNTMAVTPSGVLWKDVTSDMISLVDLATGAWTGSYKPSGERKVHREIYRRRPDVCAVVHTHQNAASACAAARVPVPTPAGLVPCAPYALPGTKTLTRGTVDALEGGTTVLMANHGVFAVGHDLDEAFGRIAQLERDCATYLETQSEQPLPGKPGHAWDSKWLVPVGAAHPDILVSQAPFTRAWAARGVALPAVLDDLAQLVGPRVPCRKFLPKQTATVLVKDLGALVSGPDAETLAIVIEKAACAALAAEGLGGAKPFPSWEAWLMHWVYKNCYGKIGRR